jgi:hypothetical protein
VSEGQHKQVTVKQLSQRPPGSFGDKKSWTVKTSDDEVIQVVLPQDQIPPKAGDQLNGTLYPPKEGTSFPPSFYPRKGGKGGGGGYRKSPEEMASIEKQVAMKGAVDLIIAGKGNVADVSSLTRDLYRAIKDAA